MVTETAVLIILIVTMKISLQPFMEKIAEELKARADVAMPMNSNDTIVMPEIYDAATFQNEVLPTTVARKNAYRRRRINRLVQGPVGLPMRFRSCCPSCPVTSKIN